MTIDIKLEYNQPYFLHSYFTSILTLLLGRYDKSDQYIMQRLYKISSHLQGERFLDVIVQRVER